MDNSGGKSATRITSAIPPLLAAKSLNLLFYVRLLTSSRNLFSFPVRDTTSNVRKPTSLFLPRSWPRTQWDTPRERDFFPEEAIYGKIARRGVKNFERRATSGWVQQVIAGDVWLFPSLVVPSSVRMTLSRCFCARDDAPRRARARADFQRVSPHRISRQSRNSAESLRTLRTFLYKRSILLSIKTFAILLRRKDISRLTNTASLLNSLQRSMERRCVRLECRKRCML